MIFFSFSCWTSFPFFFFFRLHCFHLHFHYRLKHLHVTSVNAIKVSAESAAKKGTSCYTGCGFWPLCPELVLTVLTISILVVTRVKFQHNFPKKKRKTKEHSVPWKLIAEKVSTESSHRRISSGDSKVRTTLQVFIIHSRIGMKGTLAGVYMRKHAPARVSYWDDFLISDRVYIMTGSFHISGEDFNPQSVLL